MGEARQTGTTWQQGGLDPACALQVFGMRRSGNHAITDWLMRNAPRSASGGLFFNNCTAGEDPRQGFASVDVYDPQARFIPHLNRPNADRISEAGRTPAIIVSYEDRMPPARKRERDPSHGFAAPDFDHRIIIYRSFLNWTASLLAKLQGNDDWGPVDRMRIITRAFATYADGLDRLSLPGVTGICYDRWMEDETYRADLLTQLGLPLRDNSRGEVQRFGGGSSFQKKTKNAADLRSNDRGTQMADDPEYKMLLWIAGHDIAFLERLLPHFEKDVERIADLAETAHIEMALPAPKGA
ncbi:MAG: hypothetical protein ACSHWZ_03230 [Sulfitobacter sp.]